MPFYDYVCSACGKQVELMHGANDETPRTCPDCGASMTKAFNVPAIHFKGSGWAKKERRSDHVHPQPKGKAPFTLPAPGEPVPTSHTPATTPTNSPSSDAAKAPKH